MQPLCTGLPPTGRDILLADVFFYTLPVSSTASRLPQHCAAERRGGMQQSAHKLQVFFDVLNLQPHNPQPCRYVHPQLSEQNCYILRNKTSTTFGIKVLQSSESKHLFDAVDGVVQECCQAAADGRIVKSGVQRFECLLLVVRHTTVSVGNPLITHNEIADSLLSHSV